MVKRGRIVPGTWWLISQDRWLANVSLPKWSFSLSLRFSLLGSTPTTFKLSFCEKNSRSFQPVFHPLAKPSPPPTSTLFLLQDLRSTLHLNSFLNPCQRRLSISLTTYHLSNKNNMFHLWLTYLPNRWDPIGKSCSRNLSQYFLTP